MAIPSDPETALASVSPPTMARLAFLRYLYTIGMEQSRQPEPLAAASILLFHDSVDLFLQLAAESSRATLTGGKKTYFADYFTPINDAIAPKRLSHQQAMMRLNEARNAVKHRGSLPSRHDVEQFRADVTGFFEDNTPLIFSIEYSAISMVNLVTCEPARRSLQKAEDHLAGGNTEGAQVAVAIAFAQLIRDYEQRATSQYGRSPFTFGESFSFEASFNPGDRPPFSQPDKLRISIIALQDAMKILGLGIDYRRYTKFRLLTPDVRFGFGTDPVVFKRAQPTSLEACRFCFYFVIETAIQLQEVDLDCA